jgi:hypothetical protein
MILTFVCDICIVVHIIISGVTVHQQSPDSMCTIFNSHGIVFRLLTTTFFYGIRKETSMKSKYCFVDLESRGTNFDRQVGKGRVIE